MLLATKLFIPANDRPLVARPRLLAKLDAGLHSRVILVAAPAGFGKTTLITEWSAACGVRNTALPLSTSPPLARPLHFCWLALDEYDNDPVRFLSYVGAALQTADASLGSALQTLLQAPQLPPLDVLLMTLMNDLESAPIPIVLVLDDYHVITSQPIHDALTFLVEHMPSTLRLVITTRLDPPLPLTRWRVRNQLTEVRASDLRFTLDEAATFLTRMMGLTLSGAEITTLEERTEGWIAALQLAALSMQGRHDLSGFIAAFTGSHRFIIDYLTEEVLEQRPKGTKDFLLQTSILERLCAPLCDSVTGQSEGQVTLERLEQANLFLIPLDEELRWYRYHHLFAEVLRQRLQQDHSARVPELHRRAQEWLEQNGLIHEAVNHALAGRDFEQAANLIERMIRARPRLCLARGWTFQVGPALNLESAEEWGQLAMQAAPPNQSLDTNLTGEVAALQAMIAATRSEIARSITLSRQALDALASNSPWRSVMAFCLGSTLFLAGDMMAASHALQEALRLSRSDDAHFIQLNAASFLADIQVFQGHLNQATEMYQQVLAWADHGIPQKGALMAHGGLAHILCERNQLDAALSHAQLGVEQLEQVGGAWAALMLYRALARIQQANGHWTDALDSLDRAYQTGQRTQVNIVVTQAAALRARLQLARGDLEAAAVWAANSGLSPDDPESSHPGLREEEYLTLARVLSAQGKRAEALSFLNRLWQSAEAEERMGSAIVILILQSLILQTQGNTARALMYLERALILAEPEGFVRSFVDEGDPMRALIAESAIDYKQFGPCPLRRHPAGSVRQAIRAGCAHHSRRAICINTSPRNPTTR